MAHFVALQELRVSSERTFDEWSRLNAEVRKVLSKRDISSGRGACQVEEEYQGVVSQRVVVQDPKILKPELMREFVQSINRQGLAGAQIEVVFDYSRAKATSHDYLKGLLIAHAGGVDEPLFSLEQLRAHFGDWFYTD